MEYSQIAQEIDALPDEERKVKRRLLQLVSPGGVISENYACTLAAAQSCDDFFEKAYNNDSLRSDFAWSIIARTLHPDWLSRFTYQQRFEDEPLKDGCFVMRSNTSKSDIVLPVPGDSETVDVFVFEDGEVNEAGLKPAGVYMGSYDLNGTTIDGHFSMGFDGPRLVIILWRFREDGSRVSAKVKLRVC